MAQGPSALSGTVVDAAGGALPQVTITLIDAARAVQRDAVTNAQGTFAFAALAPGRYVLRADHRSFTPAEIRDLELHAGDRLSVRVELQLHGVSEHLAVRAPASRVQTSGGAVGAVFDRHLIENMPSNGGSLQSLIALTPGVVTAPGADAIDLSVNGQRTSANYFMVDGVGANTATPLGFALRDSQAMGGALPSLTLLGTTTSLVSLDALDEVRVQTSSYAAEFGRQPGAQVSLTTRAGTNVWRGSLFTAARDETFDARDWFAKRAGLAGDPPVHHLQTGGTIGGPLRMPGYDGRDRTFFFLSHETVRQREDGVLLAALPIGSASFTLDVPRRQLPVNWPAILTRYDFAIASAALRPQQAVRARVDATSLRLDHRLASTLSLFGRVHTAPSTEDARFDPIVRRQHTRLDLTTVTLGGLWASRRVSHDLRVNVSRHNGSWREDRASDLTAKPFPLGLFLVAELHEPRFVLRLRQLAGQSESQMPSVSLFHSQEQINGVLTTTMVMGAHQVKVGADYRQLEPTVSPVEYGLRVNERQSDRPANAPFAETRVQAMATLRPQFSNLSLFAQDAWRVSPRLSIDAGLRWELNPAPRASPGDFPYMPAAVEADSSHVSTAPVGPRVWKTQYSNVAPRLGAAWLVDARPGRETALRGGGGVFYDLGSSQNANAYNDYGHQMVNTFWTTVSAHGRDVVYAPPSVRVMPLTTVYGVDQDLALPYSVHWQLSLERALGLTRSVTASYVGAAGRRLLAHRTWDLTPRSANMSPPRLDVTTNHAESDYRALQVQFQQRLSRGLHARAAYTWSHATDLASIESGVDAIALLVRGDADFDRRHVLNAAVGYALPAMTRVPVARLLLRDWDVDARLLVQSSAPIPVFGTVLDEGVRESIVWPVRVGGVPLYVDDGEVPGGRRVNREAFVLPAFSASAAHARNIARGPGAWQVDLALRRRIALGGPMTLQVRVDAFNVFNHPNFGSIDGDIGSPTFGEPRAMLGRTAVSLGSPYSVGRPRSIEFGLRLAF